MSLQSFGFFAFLLAVAVCYLHLPQRWQSPFLLGASWVFYLAAAPGLFLVTVGLAAFSYGVGRGLAGPHKTAFLRLGILGSLAILAFFKYFNFFKAAHLLPITLPDIVMPLGISFYTFASISYLIDAARGDCPVETNFVHYALFVTFFATVTSGPICRAGQLLPQFRAEHRFEETRTVNALRLFALGLFKKVAIADVLGLFVNQVFGNYATYGGPVLILAALGYTFQLYFDFCGYSEMARATGLFLGLVLPENFKTPFFATNFSGFWSRWHISLSSWLQDYLFMPLAWADASRLPFIKGKREHLPTEFCVFCVFFLSGFWHGNTLPFVVWGLLQAFYRVGEELLHRRLGRPAKHPPAAALWAKRAGVLALWTVSMVFFRVGSGPNSGTVGDAFLYLAGCLRGFSPLRFGQELYSALYTGFYANGLMVAAYLVFVPLCLALAFWLDAQRGLHFKNKPAELVLAALPCRRAIYYALVVAVLAGYILQNGGYGAAGFSLYANF
ncbi:MAG: hypothetical protein PHO10_02905 [Gemmiger sp.]|nr:hypothetical protein [Gemmiger sp.]